MKKFLLLLCAVTLVTPLYAGAQTAGQISLKCPSPSIVLDLSRGSRSNDKNTGGQVSALQAFLWQYKTTYTTWEFSQNREDFVTGSFGSRTESVLKSFQKTFLGMTSGSVGYGKVLAQTRTEILRQCLPDLIVKSVSIANSASSASSTVRIQYVRKNIGNESAENISTWDQMAYLSKDAVYDASDIPLPFTYSVSQYHLSRDWENVQTVTDKVPASVQAGQYYVIVREDINLSPSYPGVLESNENNNWKSSSTTVSVTPQQTAPAAPSNLGAAQIQNHTSIALTWQDNSINENNFVIERSIYQNFSSTVIATTTRANITSFIDSAGIASSTVYYYRARAYNMAGPSWYSQPVSAQVIQNNVVAPPAPSNISVTGVYARPPYLLLHWQDNSINEQKFVVERDTSSAFTNSEIATTTKANITQFNDYRIASTTIYYYRVRACIASACSDPSGFTALSIAYAPKIDILAPTSSETYLTASSTVVISASIIDQNKVGLVPSTATWSNAATGGKGSVIPTIYGWVAQNPTNAKFFIPLAPGENIITYRISDQYGAVGTDVIRITYQPPTPPVARIPSPAQATYRPAIGPNDLLGSVYEVFMSGAITLGNFLLGL